MNFISSSFVFSFSSINALSNGLHESLLSDISHISIMSSSSSILHISEDRDDTGIPVTCSKCNETFQTDSDYVVHYKEMHTELDPAK